MTKQIQNLINKYGADELHRMIDAEVDRQADLKRLEEIMSTHKSAQQWFTKFAKDNKLTVKQIYNQTREKQRNDYDEYGKSCLALNGWRMGDGPYAYLWLNKDGEPHLEVGTSEFNMLYDLGYKQNILNLKKIIRLRAER